jgi:hypothetical protein
MNPLFKQTGINFVGIVISRNEIESLEIAPVLKSLESMLYDAETVQAFQGQMGLSFQGYDNDPRELYEIPEIRRYLAMLDRNFPYWFYFHSTTDDTLKMLAFCLCDTRKIGAGLAYPEPEELKTFILKHFDATNRLFDHYHLDESMNEELSNQISDYFFSPTT